MRRLALLLAATAAVVTLVVIARPDAPRAERPPAAIGSPNGTSPTAVTTVPTATSSSPPRYRSGTATAVAHTDFGDVRVRVTVAHGRIVRATAVEVPHGNEMDVELSKPAVRTLEREVLDAQTVDVDLVSGATYTSTGYLSSLQAALDQLS
jgi:uncharacterized protein with FMN-binding domain